MEQAVAVALGAVHARAASFPPGRSAEIVAFPRPRAPHAAAPHDPLVNATEKLHAAACAQKAAVAAWRGSLEQAGRSLSALESSMQRYETRLAALKLDRLGAESRALAAIMDRVMDRVIDRAAALRG